MSSIISDSIKCVAKHYKENNLNWPMVIYLSLAHVAGVIGLLSLQYCHRYTLLWTFALWPITGLGITGGAHRLWAHRSYKATFALRVFLMLVNSMANQGSIWHWSRDHRVHHKYSETDADPHNAQRGFFFSHIGWLLVKKHKDIVEAGKKLNFDDLLEDPVVVFQKKLDPWINLFMCFVFPGLVCMLWGDNFWNGYWTAGALRYICVLHFTWLVNSAAHFFGDRPYDPSIWSAENPAVALVSMGEGWHNWHHKYPFDYAASEYGVTTQFNPTKLFIDTCCALGLASERKRATGAWSKLRIQRDQEIAAECKKSK